MKTSCYFVHQGQGRISIARFAPRGTPAGYGEFRPLAPGPWFNKVTKEEYRELYFKEVLGRLDPKRTFDALGEIAGDAEPILLCWERPPLTETNWCHRRLVAEWFKDTLGISVPELARQTRQLPLLGGER
jgi:hypothetical protein